MSEDGGRGLAALGLSWAAPSAHGAGAVPAELREEQMFSSFTASSRNLKLIPRSHLETAGISRIAK